MKCSQRDFNIFVNTIKGTTVKTHTELLGISAKEVRQAIDTVGSAIIAEWNATIGVVTSPKSDKKWYRGVNGTDKVLWENIADIHALKVLHNWLMKIISEITIEFTEMIPAGTRLKTPYVTTSTLEALETIYMFEEERVSPNVDRDIAISKAVYNGSSFAEVGRLFGVSGTRVHDIAGKTLRKLDAFWKRKYNRDNSYIAIPPALYSIIESKVRAGDWIYFGLFSFDEIRKNKDFFIDLLDEVTSPLLKEISPKEHAPGVEVVSLPSHKKRMNEQSLMYLNSIINS
jgi:hypothetical protein